MNKKSLYIFVPIVVAVLFGGVGFLIGKNSGPSSEEIQKQVAVDFKQKFTTKTEENLIPFIFPNSGEEKFFRGKIDSTQDGTLNVKVNNVYKNGDFFDYLNEPNFYIKTIKIGDKTKIVRQEIKNSEKLNQEMEAYNKNPTGDWPVPYDEIPMTVKDLQKDGEVSVETDTAIILEGGEVIDATKIVVENYNNGNNVNEKLENTEE